LLGLLLRPAAADEVSVAVASNFRLPAEEIATAFHAATGHEAQISSASTGMLYAQISNGAPFDVFLAADAERPRLLEEAALGIPGTRRTYALGELSLWSASPALAETACRAVLDNPGEIRIAIANPAIAPYGLAAKQFLERSGLWARVEPRLVYGENIAQTLQFVATGNAQLGFVARAQLADPRLPPASCRWDVPNEMHAPIEQQSIALLRGAGNPAVQAFLDFLQSAAAADIIMAFGYRLPQ
jgi:molybdate transport system substrate-binding protein